MYATLQDAIDLYGETYVVTSVDRDLNGEIDEDATTEAFANASSKADSYLSERYHVPVSPVPDALKEAVIDLAIYRLSSGPGAGLTDEKTARAKAALDWLKDIAKGLANLAADSATDDTAASDLPRTSYVDREFTRAKLDGVL